ncbi:MAG: hypothetical protein QXR76_03210 [Candidatus Bathyarchaeia archaeon]
MNKLKISVLAEIILVTGLLFALLPNPTFYVEQPVSWQGSVNVKVIRNGHVIYEYTQHNILVTIGSTWIKDFLKSGTTGAANATDDIAVGNHTTPSVSDTKLQTECTIANLTRQDCSASVTNLNATAYQVVYSRIASAMVTINATSLHHDPTPNTDNNAVAIANILQASLIANDQIQVTWTVNVPAG